MKTKLQKQEELKKGKELLDKSQVLIFTDFTKVATEDLRKLRKDLKNTNANLKVIKKNLLSLLLKERGVDFDLDKFKLQIGTIFSQADMEKISAPVFKFFSSLEIPEGADKGLWLKHILGGYDIKNKSAIDSERIIFIGKLPPREVLLAQLLGMLSAPVRSFLYILDQKSKTPTPERG